MDNREINQLVARHVMGWTDVGMHEHGRRNSLCAGCRQGHIEFVPHGWMPGEDSATHWRQQIPEFSTSAEAAKQVREKLYANGFTWTLMSPVRDYRKFGCVLNSGTDHPIVEHGETEELAICKCALLAVGIDPYVLLPGESQEKV